MKVTSDLDVRQMALRSDRLHAIRAYRGVSKREFARQCGVTDSMISKYENGEGEPTVQTLKVMAEALKVSADYLLGMAEDPQIRFGEFPFEDEERKIVETFRKEGWSGVAHLSVEKLSGR